MMIRTPLLALCALAAYAQASPPAPAARRLQAAMESCAASGVAIHTTLEG